MKIESKNFRQICFVFALILVSFTELLITACSVTKNKENLSAFSPKTVLKLNSSNNNPRNSEGDFITLKDGRIMFIYSRYTGSSSNDHAPAYLAARYSNDGGRTWSSEDEIVLENEGGMNVMSVSLLRLNNSNIALFYLRKNSTIDCIPMMRISTDEAKSWSDAVPCITDKKGYFVLNNDRVIQLQDGRLLMAVALHQLPRGKWKDKADLYSYFSDDNGKTWHSSSQVPNNTNIITQEPGLIEMKDGRLMMYIRASGGFQQLSFSSDRGQTWSHIEPSNIPSPLSPASIERIPNTDDWLLAWNNNDGSNPLIKGERTPLTVAISKNEGKTWKKIKNIQDDPDGWYCYIAIHFVGKEDILLGNCAGSQSQNTHLSVTAITLLNKKWIYE
ncbi:sialidase family protein [Petrimonas sp.]|uniref:sialidase family protein n=1 Tax=Petrimonas sp. TaxID=2023866 RepID=UPI002FCB9261